jgi:hypothetical protein
MGWAKRDPAWERYLGLSLRADAAGEYAAPA